MKYYVHCSLKYRLDRGFHYMLVDEIRDISNRVQLVLCVRWVSDHYEVFEDQIGLQLENTRAETIYSSERWPFTFMCPI